MIEPDNIYNMDCLEGLRQMEDATVDCCVTSPPYFALRDYGCEGQIGLEQSPEEYIARLCDVFREVLRVMKPEATCWVVIGDTYAGSNKGAACYPDNAKLYLQGTNAGTLDRATSYRFDTVAKDRDLIGIPWMLAFALRDMGFYLRQDIIWQKPNPMPESVKNRCTKSHEYIFLLTKQPRYNFSVDALREPANTGIRAQEYNHRKGEVHRARSPKCAVSWRQPERRLPQQARRVADTGQARLRWPPRHLPRGAASAVHRPRLSARRPGARPFHGHGHHCRRRLPHQPPLCRLRAVARLSRHLSETPAPGASAAATGV